MDESPRWYRVLSALSTVVWLTAAWIVASLPVVTAPAALVALHDGARRLVDGDPPTWRGFRDVVVSRWKTAAAFGAMLALPWTVIVVVLLMAVGGNQAILAGMVAALGLVTGAITAATWYVIAITDAGISGCLQRLIAAIMFRPLSLLAMSAPWWGLVVLVFATHQRIAVMAALLGGPMCAVATCVIARWHGQRNIDSATPRGRLRYHVLDAEAEMWGATSST